MKIKIKDKNIKLPNVWKQCGLSIEEWEELQKGKAMEVNSIPDVMKNLVDVEVSASKSKTKSTGGK